MATGAEPTILPIPHTVGSAQQQDLSGGITLDSSLRLVEGAAHHNGPCLRPWWDRGRATSLSTRMPGHATRSREPVPHGPQSVSRLSTVVGFPSPGRANISG